MLMPHTHKYTHTHTKTKAHGPIIITLMGYKVKFEKLPGRKRNLKETTNGALTFYLATFGP